MIKPFFEFTYSIAIISGIYSQNLNYSVNALFTKGGDGSIIK